MGTNGFLSTAIAKYANKEHWALDMYGLDTPVRHKYDNFYKMKSDGHRNGLFRIDGF